MTANDDTPTGVHELFRYWRDDEVRVYNLHVVAGGVELWRVINYPDASPAAVLEERFNSAETAATFIHEVERTLDAGGWRRVSSDGQ